MIAAAKRPRGAFTVGYVTPTELAVWKLVALGHQSVVIADLIGCGKKAIEKHRSELFRKLGAHSMADLTRKAIEHGVIVVEVRPLVRVVNGRERHLLPG